MSWWEHVEKEVSHLSALGFTQIWLPPPNKAAQPVSANGSGYKFKTKMTIGKLWI